MLGAFQGMSGVLLHFLSKIAQDIWWFGSDVLGVWHRIFVVWHELLGDWHSMLGVWHMKLDVGLRY